MLNKGIDDGRDHPSSLKGNIPRRIGSVGWISVVAATLIRRGRHMGPMQ